jgi:adenylate cyclase
MSEGTQRRLAAIVAIDVAGYSRLMGADEEGTLATLKAHREAVTPIVQQHGGRIVGTAGDGLLLEFPSVTEAVLCATKVQPLMAERNNDIPADRKMLYRVGINLGDVMIDGDDVYGDGVNIAARLEALAEPGGVCISQTVLEHVQDRVDALFQDMGEIEVKNIARPVRVWRWRPDGVAPTPADRSSGEETDQLPPPDRPSIAVLPFDNMSGDLEQEYFADGIAEDVITDLSKFSWLTVIARNSSFSYKNKTVDLRTVADELAVRYVLEGSVRKSGNRVRVTAQLIDASDGSHIWADRYDRDLDDIFALQDEMNESIVRAIAPQLETLIIRRAQDKRSENLDAWDYILRAKYLHGEMNEDSNNQTIELANKALALDPEYPDALATLAMAYATRAYMRWTDRPDDSIRQSIEVANRALRRDPDNSAALVARGWSETLLGQFDEAVDTLNLAVALNPNDPAGHHMLSVSLYLAGDYGNALDSGEFASKISPRGVLAPHIHHTVGLIHFALGNLDEAKTLIGMALQADQTITITHRNYAAACVELEEQAAAEQAMARFMELEPQVTVKLFLETSPLKDAKLRNRLAEGFEAAGMPKG